MKKYHTDEELSAIQISKEIAMKTAGIERWNLNNERAIKEGANSDTNWNKRIIHELVSPMADAIDIYLDYYNGRAGKPSKSLSYLRMLPSTQSAYITIKNILDSLTRETEVLSVAKTIGLRIEDQVRFAGIADEAPRYIEKVQKALAQNNSKQYRHKQAVLANANKSLVQGNEDKEIEPRPDLKWQSWPEQELCHLGSHLITIFSENVLFEDHPVVYKRVIINGKSNKSYLSPTEEMEEWVEKYKEAMEVMSPAFAPCVVPPREWTAPRKGGYYISEISETLPLVKCKKSQLKRLTYKQMPEVYDAVNTLQNVAWQVSDRVYEVAKQVINLGLPYGVPSKEPIEFPESPAGPEYDDMHGLQMKDVMSDREWKEFTSWKAETTRLHTMNNKRKADFLKVARVMSGAGQYLEFEKIYFVYTLDFRGRVYCKTDSISPQGQDLQKGLIHFGEALPLGNKGAYWLAVHGANLYGEDKCTFNDREAYIIAHRDMILDIAADPLTFTEWAGADKPYQFLNWCFEWADLQEHIDSGKPASSFESRIPIAMDGSCSGLQHYSAILRDPVGGKAVNLVPSDFPQDIYAEAAMIAQKKMEFVCANDDDMDQVELAETWLNILGGIARGLTKQPCMTYTYGSTQIRCLDTTGAYLVDLQAKEDAKAKAQSREPVKVHGFAERKGEPGPTKFEGEKFGSKMIWKSIGEVVVAAKTAMKFIQEVAKVMALNSMHLECITPTGFIFEQREMDYSTKRVKTQLMGQTYMSLTTALDTFNVRKMKSSSAPNFIHSMDASHLIKAVNECKKWHGIDNIAVIHDSFGTHACNTESLRTALLDSFVDMYQEHDVLQDFLDHNESRLMQEIKVEVPGEMGLDLESVRTSTYCFG